MDFFTFLINASFINVSFFVIGCYILLSICFGVYFTSLTEFAIPNLLNSFNFFSLFFLFSVFWLFALDLNFDSALYFFNQNFQIFFLFVTILALFVSRDFLINKVIVKYEYDILFMLFVFSSLCLCFADDFLIIYLAIELQSLVFYVFSTFQRNSEFSTEAGLKYFVFGAVISCFLLLGFALIYLSFGSVSFEFLYSLSMIKNDSFFFSGILFILIALLFKVGSAPFHSWLCDVYDGSILSVTLLFASAPKIILFSLIIKLVFLLFFSFNELFTSFFLFASISSIAVGSFSALYQKRIKRLFAYSTIAHTGFILLAILASSGDSAKSLIFYIVIYSLLTVLLFSLLINSVVAGSNQPKYLANLTSFGLKNTIFAASFGIVLFSIAGIPPLAGFFSKFFVLFSVIVQEYYFTAITVIILSSIACFYYIRLIKMFFFTKSLKTDFWVSSPTKQNTEIVISFLFFLNICFFIEPTFLSYFSTIVGLILF